jgi:hypothetical protein
MHLASAPWRPVVTSLRELRVICVASRVEYAVDLQAYRDNHRIAVASAAFADMLWQRTGFCHVCASLEHEGCHAIGLNDNIRLYWYMAGQKFGRLVDDSVQLPGGRRTAYTLLVYLSGGGSKADRLVGGETVFCGDRGHKVHGVKPTCGKALLHLHGDVCLEHEGTEVRSGCKYVLRSDVVFGPSAT